MTLFAKHFYFFLSLLSRLFDFFKKQIQCHATMKGIFVIGKFSKLLLKTIFY